MNHILENIRKAFSVLWRPMIGSAAIGAFTGLLGALLWRALSWCDSEFTAHPWTIWLLPISGILIAAAYKRFSHIGGTNQVLEAVRGNAQVSPLIVPLIAVGTFLTRVFGGSVGSEGAAIQIGGGIASIVARWLRVSEQQAKVLIMTGISGGFASVVGTPVTAIMLAIELTGSGIMLYEAILPCSAASTISYAIAASLGVSFPKIALHGIEYNAFLPGLQVVVLAALGGVLSIALCEAITRSASGYKRIFRSPIFRAVCGGLLLGLITFLVGTTSFNGGGLGLIEEAAAGRSSWYDFLLKIAFTALTIGAGYRGGAIVPTLATGASFGGFFGPLLGMSPALGAGIGMTSVFCGAINCPMTAFVLGLEMFGLNGALYFILACSVSYVCSGYTSLYSAQIIRFSKLDGHEINRHAS